MLIILCFVVVLMIRLAQKSSNDLKKLAMDCQLQLLQAILPSQKYAEIISKVSPETEEIRITYLEGRKGPQEVCLIFKKSQNIYINIEDI